MGEPQTTGLGAWWAWIVAFGAINLLAWQYGWPFWVL